MGGQSNSAPKDRALAMNTHIQTLADAGAHFVLCKSNKHPVEKWKDKRPSASRARKWLKEEKENLLGIVPGSLGLLVVDIDKDIESARKIVAGISKPLSEADTRKGKHLYYPKTKARTGNSSWQYGDIRQDAGYAIMWNIAAVVAALKNLPGEPFDVKVLPDAVARPADAADDGDKGGRNNRLWGVTFRAGLLGDEKARARAEEWAKLAGLPDSEIKITSEKGWTTGSAARLNKILPSMDATCLEAALALKGIDYRYNTRSMSPEINVPDGYGCMSGWQPVDDMKEARMFGDIAREIKLYTSPTTKDKPFDVPLPKRRVFMDDVLEDRRVDPFEYWLADLPAWDKKPRIDTLLIDLFGAEDTKLNRWAGRYIPMGAIQRTWFPGCKLDEILVLVGKQGIGKSALLRQILPEAAYFSDGLNFNASARERVESLLGYVIVEASEMAGITRAKIDSLKAFISRAEDGSIRLAYRRNKDVLPRRCIIVGTSNEQMVLPNDPSGNRRFVAVKCSKGANIERFMTKNRDQLWAEAVTRVGECSTANLPRDLMPAQSHLNREFRSQDEELESLIQRLPASVDGLTMDRVFELLGIKVGARITQRRMGPALIENGWRKPNPKRSCWVSPEGWAPRTRETDEPI